ncbi:6-carboxytetrahydropterin synthase [bacterium]|nr:6-carboxytetrahydropterin synthase [candidate division CSSED10-310 bacterium]
MYRITVESGFSAAHSLHQYPGDCERLHGHNWKVEASFETENLDATGIGLDFRLARSLLSNALLPLDHTHLNEIREFQSDNPSCENIARYLYDVIRDAIPGSGTGTPVRLHSITVWESSGARVTYSRKVPL